MQMDGGGRQTSRPAAATAAAAADGTARSTHSTLDAGEGGGGDPGAMGSNDALRERNACREAVQRLAQTSAHKDILLTVDGTLLVRPDATLVEPVVTAMRTILGPHFGKLTWKWTTMSKKPFWKETFECTAGGQQWKLRTLSQTTDNATAVDASSSSVQATDTGDSDVWFLEEPHITLLPDHDWAAAEHDWRAQFEMVWHRSRTIAAWQL